MYNIHEIFTCFPTDGRVNLVDDDVGDDVGDDVVDDAGDDVSDDAPGFNIF